MTADAKSTSDRLGWLPGAAAALAFIACNGLSVFVAALSLLGITMAVNPHLQAAAITAFALLTVVFVILGFRRNRQSGPVALSLIGAVVIAGTMYIYFSKVVESIGLLVLIVSAVWSWRATKSCARADRSRSTIEEA